MFWVGGTFCVRGGRYFSAQIFTSGDSHPLVFCYSVISVSITTTEIDELNSQANIEREVGDLGKSLELAKSSQQFATAEKYNHGLVGALLIQAKTYKLQYQISKDKSDLNLMIDSVHQANLVADISNEDKVLVFENLAEVSAEKNDWESVAEYWNMIIDLRQKEDAYLGRAQTHLAEAVYHLNQKDRARALAYEAVTTLLKYRVDGDYTWTVWYSGALMKLFYILHMDIEDVLQDERLSHRRRQWKELKGLLKFN